MLSVGAPRRNRNISAPSRYPACAIQAEIPRQARDDSLEKTDRDEVVPAPNSLGIRDVGAPDDPVGG